MTYLPIPVSTAKEIAGKFGKDWIVILAYNHEHNLTHTTTYGVSPHDKVNAANAGEIAAAAIGCDISKKDFSEDFRKDLDAGKQAVLREACEIAHKSLVSLKAQCDEREWHEDWQDLPKVLEKLTTALA